MSPSSASLPPETQRRTRGHNFYPPKDVRDKVPVLGVVPTDAPRPSVPDRTVHVHYFTGAWDWYVLEADWETGMAFGMVTSPICPDGELGDFYLPELEQVQARAAFNPTGATEGLIATGSLSWVVERDCHWEPKPLREAMAR